MSKDSRPYQKGDFVKDREGRTVAYRGPIYDLTYPGKLGLDPTVELLTWGELGYKTEEAETPNIAKGDFTVRVWGDISKKAKKVFKAHGVKVEKTKKRGPAITLSQSQSESLTSNPIG